MLNFRGTRGILVKYSEHYLKVHCVPKDSPLRKRIGVVLDTQVYQEEGTLVNYPIVAWEGVGGIGSVTHPDNVRPYRRSVKLPRL